MTALQSRRTPRGHRETHPVTVCLRLTKAEAARLRGLAEADGHYPTTWAALAVVRALEEADHAEA